MKVVQDEGNGEESSWDTLQSTGPVEKPRGPGFGCEHQRSLWQLSCLLAKMRGMISGGTFRTASRISREE